MSEYRVEFDVPLWQYVLRIGDDVIPLNKQNIRDAEWYARLIVEGRKNRNDSSTGHHNPIGN
jgi:hypothetical protein